MTVVSDVHGYESHVHLQIALCRVLCLMNTSRLDLAKSVLQVVCRSSMLQQLIRNISMQQPDQIDFSNMLSRDIVWAVFYLDMHISSLLNIPPSLPQPGSEIATVYTINAAIYNVTNFRRSESTFLLSVSVAMAIELMKLTQSMRCNEETFRASSSQDFVTEDAAVQDLLVRVEIRTQCETWETLLQATFTDDDCDPALMMSVFACTQSSLDFLLTFRAGSDVNFKCTFI